MSGSDIRKRPGVDGAVSRYLNRPLSRPTARMLAHTPVTPNQVTVVSLLLAVAAGWLLAGGFAAAGAVAIHASSVIDGVDGDLARLTGKASRFGGLFDAVLDRYADAAIVGGMAWYAYRHETAPAPLLLGLAALTGSFAMSYSRARAESSIGETLTSGFLGAGSRDVRLFVAALCCLVGRPYAGLLAIGLGANMIVVARLIYLRRRLRSEPAAPARPSPDR